MFFPEVITVNYIISQVIGGIAVVLVCIAYCVKSKRKLLFFQIMANLAICISYFFLGTYFAFIGTGLATIRTLFFYLYERKGKVLPIWLFCLLILLFIFQFFIVFEDWYNLLPLAVYITFTIAFRIDNIKLLKITLIFASIARFIFDLVKHNYSSLVLSLIEFTILVIGLIIIFTHEHKEKKQKQKENLQSKNTIQEQVFADEIG